jgi:TRAP transporter TAXI family solute receptor
MQKIFSVIVGLSVIIGLSGCSSEVSQKDFVTVGTGGVTGVYYPTGGAISRMINAKSEEYHLKMTVESTAGSVYNINAVLNGELDFGVAQSDRQYQAVNGLAEWDEKGNQERLRSVFAIHPESVTLVVSEKSEINSVIDLKGKRVNIGSIGSGIRQNALDTLMVFGLNEKDIFVEQVKATEAPGLLQNGTIDAFFYTVGHPNGNIKEATAGRNSVRIIDIVGNEREKILKDFPYYAASTIEKSLYPQIINSSDVQTFGVKATLVTSVDVNAEIVYAVTKEVFENFEDFKKLHPAYSTLTKENMLEGLSAPIHEGALRYYQEVGLK